MRLLLALITSSDLGAIILLSKHGLGVGTGQLREALPRPSFDACCLSQPGAVYTMHWKHAEGFTRGDSLTAARQAREENRG